MSPFTQRRARAREILKLAGQVINVTDEIEKQAETFIKTGIKPIDALHVATASRTKADYFCTCDDQLLKKGKKLKNLDTKVVSPLELIEEVMP
jgi:predicted nucleic acid-binding protein